MTEVKSVDVDEGRKHPYCSIEEGVQKHHSGKYGRLLEHLQPSDHVSSEPHSAYASPVGTSKEKKGGGKGCVFKDRFTDLNQFSLNLHKLPVLS